MFSFTLVLEQDGPILNSFVFIKHLISGDQKKKAQGLKIICHFPLNQPSGPAWQTEPVIMDSLKAKPHLLPSESKDLTEYYKFEAELFTTIKYCCAHIFKEDYADVE